jgi:hypothetical protein
MAEGGADREVIVEYLAKVVFATEKKDETLGAINLLTGAITKLGIALAGMYSAKAFIDINKHFNDLGIMARNLNTPINSIRTFEAAFNQVGNSAGAFRNALVGLQNQLDEFGPSYRKVLQTHAGLGSFKEGADNAEELIKFIETTMKKYDGNEAMRPRGYAQLKQLIPGLTTEMIKDVMRPEFRQSAAEANRINTDYLGSKEEQDELVKNAQKFTSELSFITQRLSNLFAKTIVSPELSDSVADFAKTIDENKDTIKDGMVAIGQAVTGLAKVVAMLVAIPGVVKKISGAMDEKHGEPKGVIDAFSQGWKSLSAETDENTQAVKENTDALKEQKKGWWQWFKDLVLKEESKEVDVSKPGDGLLRSVLKGLGLISGESGGGAAGGGGDDNSVNPVGSGGTAGKETRANMMHWAMDQLRKEGVPESSLRAAAANLVGQADMESGLNPNKSHDQGTGYGIYGARLDRRTKMFAWLAQNNYAKNSAEGQMRYMAREAMSGAYPKTRSILMSGSLNAGSSHTITDEFERPKINNYRHGAVSSAFSSVGSRKETPTPTPTPTPTLTPTPERKAPALGGRALDKGAALGTPSPAQFAQASQAANNIGPFHADIKINGSPNQPTPAMVDREWKRMTRQFAGRYSNPAFATKLT